MIFPKLETLAKGKGVEARQLSPYHIQLKGIYVVNIYETTGKFYISGMNKSQPYDMKNLQRLVDIACGEYDFKYTGVKAKRKKFSMKQKALAFARNNVCFFCDKDIETIQEASWEHCIPLSRGGSNRKDNMALSHEKCNQERKDSIKVKEISNGDNES